MSSSLDGFWLPRNIRTSLLSTDTTYDTLSLAGGRPCEPDDPRAVTMRWPRLQQEQWTRLLAAIQENRQKAPRGPEFWERLQIALRIAGQRMANPTDPLHAQAMSTLPGYTGYSEAMIGFTLGALDMVALDQLSAAMKLSPTRQTAHGWQKIPGLPGRLHFTPANPWVRVLGQLPGWGNRPLFNQPQCPDVVVGYGSGNVPGTALLITMLSLAVTLTGNMPPAVIVRNSRREPIFARLIFDGIEAVDPEIVCTTALLIWDYQDPAVQSELLPHADLVIAAASDDTIAQLATRINLAQRTKRRTSPGPIRFQAHGHKVSFTAIGRDVLAHDLREPATGHALLDVVTLLAGLDSVFWDQNGCLSSRIHFVEEGTEGYHTPLDYAVRLNNQLQMLAAVLPRGAWPRQQLRDRFDKYKLLEVTGQVQVLSNYEDDYVLALDSRPLTAAGLRAAINDCQGRVILVRPVGDLMQIPEHYLSSLPASNLQSLSVAVGPSQERPIAPFLRFAEACAACGVTALRTVGRGAFPQLAYSWDGFLPLDLVRQRPAGRFTTIESDDLYEQMLETYRTFQQRAATLAPS